MCALVHAIKPSLIAWDSLNRADELGNLNLAFDAAEKIGVPRLLDAEDMTPGPPEPFSVTTYLGTFYHAAQKFEASGAKEPERPKATAAATPARNSASTAVANTPAQSGMSKENVVPLSMGPSCTKCAKPAQGSMIDWNGNLYHQDCFKCAGCNRQFRNTCLNIDGLPYCDTCGRKAFVKSRMIRAGRETADASPGAASVLPPKDEPSSHARTNSSTNPATSTSSASARTAVPKAVEKPASPAAPALPAKNDTVASTNSTSASKLSTPASSTAAKTTSYSSTVSEKPATTAAAPALPAKNETPSPSYSASTAKSSYTTPSSTTKSSTSPSSSVSATAAPALPPKDNASTSASATSNATTGKTTSNIAARAASFAPKPANDSKPTTTAAASPATPQPASATTFASSNATSNLKPTSSVAGRSTSMAPAWNASRNQTSTSSAPTLPLKNEPTTSSYSSAAKTTSSATIKETPKAAATAPELPKKNETIIEREMREQREKEAELAAAREKARGGSSPTPTTSPSTASSYSSSMTSAATASKPALSTPTATTTSRGLYKAQTIASSTPTQAASAQTAKKETIIEKEMREQREKEEQLARDRERATNNGRSPSTISKPSSPSPVAATSPPPTLPERTTSPPPTLPPKNTLEPAKPEPSKFYSTPKPLRPISPPPSNLSTATTTTSKHGNTSPRNAADSDAPTLPPRSPRSPSPPVGAPPVPSRTVSDAEKLSPREDYNKPLPPAPSRPQSLAPSFIQSSGAAPTLPVRDYAKDPINPASSTASSSNGTLDLADDVSETENEAPEVAEKMKRATRTLRRVNVTRVQEGTKGFLKRRDKSLFWTTQWFSLQDYRLLFYEKAQAKFALASEHPPDGFFSLQFVDSVTHVNGKKLLTLDGGTAYGKVELKASSSEEAADWAIAINDAITMFRVTTRDDDLRKSSKPVFGQEHAEDWIMQGTLQRLTPKGSFSSNWWLLQDGMLFYFSHEGGKRLGRIPLFHCEFAPYELDTKKKAAIRAFCITTHTGEKVVLCAKDEMEMHRWLNCMLRQRIVIEEAINTISF